MSKYTTAYYNILKRVLKPSRYIGGEINQILKEHFSIRFCLAFPDTYEIGMSHLGLRILYHYLNKENDIFAERVFAPWPDMEELLREENIPLLSLESKTPLSEFDAVGFSLQYELEYSNVLNMLELSNIPLRSSERSIEDPFIIAGGPVAVNPEPLAPFIDIFLIGDGENVTADLLRLLQKGKRENLPRKTILENASRLPGMYVPSLYEYHQSDNRALVPANDGVKFPVKKNLLDRINDYPFPAEIIVPHHEIVHDRISIEIARGCTQGCRFCQAGFIYRPVRERSASSIMDSIEQSVRNTGYKDVSLTSLSPADFSGLTPMISTLSETLSKENISLHLSSLRVYGLSKEIAQNMAKGRKTGFTIAPEAGSQRLRDVINKNISEEDIFTGARNGFEQGWELIKLYTMIGLPTETDEDVEAIADMAIRIWELGKSIVGKKARINLAVSTFIPKPFTPFQWSPFISREDFERKRQIIINKLIPYKKIKFNFNNYDVSVLEAVLSRGDRQIADVVYEIRKQGARFDAWRDYFDHSVWDNAFTKLNIDVQAYLTEIAPDSPLPWDHLDLLIDKKFLQKEYEKAQKGKSTPPCEQPLTPDREDKTDAILNNGKYVCYDCGIKCDLASIRKEQQQEINNWKNLQKKSKTVIPPIEEKEGGYKYVINFSKKRPLHLLSHLDTVQLLIRLFHRCNIPMHYSSGFRPRPFISIARALGLGIESNDEWMIIALKQQIAPKRLLEILNENRPQGLLFFNVFPTEKKIIWDDFFTEQYYCIVVPENVASPASLTENSESYNAAAKWIFSRERKKGVKEIDLKKFISIRNLSQDGDGTALTVKLYSPPSGSARLDDFLQQVFNISSARCTIIKEKAEPIPVIPE